MQTIALLADQHIPFIDRRADEVARKIAKAAKPDIVWLLGDLLDFAPLSRFRDADDYPHTVQQELDEAQAYLALLRKEHPNAQIVLQAGNHEYRLDSYLRDNAKKLLSLRSLELAELLRIEDYDIDLIRGRRYLARGQLVLKHGTKYGVNASKTELFAEGRSGVCGHLHKSRSYSHRTPGRKPTYWYHVGCLCKLDAPYRTKDDNPCDWNHGMAVLSIDGANVGVENVTIHRGKAVWRGRSFEA